MMLPLVINGEIDPAAYIRASDVSAVYNEHHIATGEGFTRIELSNGARFMTDMPKKEVLRLMAVERVAKDTVQSCVSSLRNATATLEPFCGVTKDAGRFPVRQASDNIDVVIKVLNDLVSTAE